MQITGPHFLDGHRHPWLHRADNDNPESPPRDSKKHQTISLFKYPESARGGASRMARSKAECHRRRTRHHCVTADPGGTMLAARREHRGAVLRFMWQAQSSL